MKTKADNHYDLAIVDPPYGINFAKKHTGKGWTVRESKDWDKEIPPPEYWEQLFRISKNQIVWGGNYFALPMNRCFLIWDKVAHMDTLADCEYAWTSFDRNAKIFKHVRNTSETRIHICQKPIKLYEWIFKNFAVEGNLILDTHLGSGSSRIAANKAGLPFVGFEISKDYYDLQEKRFKDFVSQLRMF